MDIPLTGPETAETHSNSIKHLAAALRKAKEQGKPFVIAWRQSDEEAGRWQGEAGAGCACGSGD